MHACVCARLIDFYVFKGIDQTWWICENFEKSSGGIHQSNKLRFSLILDSFTLFGRTLWPLWIPHLRATCAGDLLSFSAISIKIGSFKISPFTHDPGEPRGEYACKISICWKQNVSKKEHRIHKCRTQKKTIYISRSITVRWTPVDKQKLWSAGCCQTGWHSTWLTAGGTLAYLSKSWSFLVEKLLIPIARAWPEANKPSIAFHVSGRHKGAMTSGSQPLDPNFVLKGQCICDKIIYYQKHQFFIQQSSISVLRSKTSLKSRAVQDINQCSQAAGLLKSLSVPLRHLQVHNH